MSSVNKRKLVSELLSLDPRKSRYTGIYRLSSRQIRDLLIARYLLLLTEAGRVYVTDSSVAGLH